MKKTVLMALLLGQLQISFAQNQLQGVYPTNWWVGMKNPKLQLMLRGDAVASFTYSISDPGVKLVKQTKAENPHYLFLDLVIQPSAKPGPVKINWKNGSQSGSFSYELKHEEKATELHLLRVYGRRILCT
jgi:hypothetical protein